MADNYLEKHRDEYEMRKQIWLRSKKKKFPKTSLIIRNIEKEGKAE